MKTIPRRKNTRISRIIPEANQAAYAAVAATEVGDMCLSRRSIDLEKGTIDDNASDELLWYQDGYVSNAKLTFTKPSDSATDESENRRQMRAKLSVVNAALGKTYTLKGLFTRRRRLGRMKEERP